MKTTTILFLFSSLLAAEAILGIGRKQSIAVQGRLICEGRPAGNVRVKLYEKEILLDSKLDEVRTDSNGVFQVRGSKSEISRIDPKVNIYHRCNYIGLCWKKLSIDIPKNYITRGENPNQVYDIGTINLANKFKGESTDCIN